MRILIDTNVLIHRENYHIVPENLQRLMSALNSRGVSILVHPKSLEELKQNGDAKRREISLSKVQTYSVLDAPPFPERDSTFFERVGIPQSSNDKVDCIILYAVYRNAVDFLISEDYGVHSRASKLNIRDRVLSVDEALALFRTDADDSALVTLPALKEEYVYNLEREDSIFDSLKAEYDDFNTWWSNISREGRKSLVVFEEDSSIAAILIYKSEDEAISSTPPLPRRGRLKLCTLKVKRTGQKIGELFIKEAVRICISRHIDEMYLTHYTKSQDYLVDLISEFGFRKVAEMGREDVYCKGLIPGISLANKLSPSEISKNYYPSFYDGPRVKKFIVPILPEYHERLFTDYKKRQTILTEYAGEFVVEGNTISKAYLSHSPTRNMDIGDVLLFYRSRDFKAISTLGVVEHVFVERKLERVIERVSKRTVYSFKELERMIRKPTLVILFRWHCHLPQEIALEELKSMNIIDTAPRSISRLSHKNYLKIKKRSSLDERYTVN